MSAERETASSTEAIETVMCRPSGDAKGIFWVAIGLGILLVLGVIVGVSTSPGFLWSDLGFGLLVGAVVVLPLGVISAAYLSKACIIADSTGLRWRGIGNLRTADWKHVTAYYGYWPSVSSVVKFRIDIKTPAGNFTLSPKYWSSEAQLMESIKQNAREVSGPGLSEPQVKRNSTLPLRCSYDTAINRNILGWLDNLHKYGLLAVAIYFGYTWFTTHTLPGWGWLLTPTGIFVIVKQMLPLALRPMYRATQPRLGDKVIADEQGLRFVSTQNDTVIRWEEITDFYIVGIRYVIVTENGEQDFLTTLTDAERLRAVIPNLAVNAGRSGWRQTGYRSGTMRVRQIGLVDGRQSVECRYHYRSLINCGQLWGATLAVLFLAGVTLGPALIAAQSGAAASIRELAAAAIGIFGLCALLWLWASYWVCGIRTNEEGLTQTTLLGARRLAWSQVRGFRWSGSADLSWGIADGMTGTIKFWKGIGDADRLADEITAHAIKS